MSEDGDTSMFNGGSNFDLVDPNLDPELALVCDLSLNCGGYVAPLVYTP